MRAHIAHRLRSSSINLNAVPPPQNSSDYSTFLAKLAASILFRSPIPSPEGFPIYILNAAALPDSHEADFDALLPYVLARLPGEEELIGGANYEVIFLAGGGGDGATTSRKNRPGWGWFVQAYHVLSRAMRKRIQKLYIVHERSWVRVLVEMFSTIVSPKFRRKIVHVSTLSNLALHIPIENLLIPPTAYLHDRRLSPDIFAPYVTGRRAFSVKNPLPLNSQGKKRLPRILRETTNFLLAEPNITTEGLFRIPPHAKYREILREAYDRGQKYIIWKENGFTLPVPIYPGAEATNAIIDEVDPRDAYGVHLAAGLTKFWYAELRQPIFPQAVYRELKKEFGSPDEIISLERLTELISPQSEWSFLPAISREILTRHLLPFLSIVTAHQESNKMTPENLGVCWAPALLCGPDQLEDAKMSSVIRRILTKAIEMWSEGLRKACSVDERSFAQDILSPAQIDLYEDPLEKQGNRDGMEPSFEPDEKLHTGIILKDNENSAEMPPPLPPRAALSSSQPSSPVTSTGSPTADVALKRKPAPPLNVQPPRYSTVVGDGPNDKSESPASYSAVTDGFAPQRTSPTLPDEKQKSGTSVAGIAPQLIVPKRKALTEEQIGNTKKATSPQTHTFPSSQMKVSLPGLSDANAALKRKPIPPEPSLSPKDTNSPQNTRSASVSLPKPGLETGQDPQLKEMLPPPPHHSASLASRKPSWPFIPTQEERLVRPSSLSSASGESANTAPVVSRNRKPTITSLARPVFPALPNPQSFPTPATLAPPTAPKPRTPSPGLLRRMPSFEPKTAFQQSMDRDASLRVPKKLNLKQASVDDLRRLYEERVPTAKTLVMAGKGNMRA